MGNSHIRLLEDRVYSIRRKTNSDDFYYRLTYGEIRLKVSHPNFAQLHKMIKKDEVYRFNYRWHSGSGDNVLVDATLATKHCFFAHINQQIENNKYHQLIFETEKEKLNHKKFFLAKSILKNQKPLDPNLSYYIECRPININSYVIDTLSTVFPPDRDILSLAEYAKFYLTFT